MRNYATRLSFESHHMININTKLLGYLDDTTWFSSSLQHLVDHLKIADEFYNFANIKINKEKTKLLTNDKDLLTLDHLSLPFCSDDVEVKIIKKNQSERILGVYINMDNSPTFTYNKIADYSTCLL